jgi:hypothetical protein
MKTMSGSNWEVAAVGGLCSPWSLVENSGLVGLRLSKQNLVILDHARLETALMNCKMPLIRDDLNRRFQD